MAREISGSADHLAVLEEIRGPVNAGQRGHNDPDRNDTGRTTTLPKENLMTVNNTPTTSQKEAAIHDYLAFRPYPLEIGHKLFIESGPRRGDWEVIDLSDRKVKLRCPCRVHTRIKCPLAGHKMNRALPESRFPPIFDLLNNHSIFGMARLPSLYITSGI